MLSDSARKVQDALEHFGLTLRVVEMPQSTRTAKNAAEAIGCTVAQIGKSIIFRGARSGKAILVVTSGVNRVDGKSSRRTAGSRSRKRAPNSSARRPDLS